MDFQYIFILKSFVKVPHGALSSLFQKVFGQKLGHVFGENITEGNLAV